MRVIKGLIALVLIASIVGVVGLYSQLENLGVVTTFFQDLAFQYDWLFYFYQVVLYVLLLLLFLAFLVVLFKPIRKKEIHVKKEMGQINVPLHSLESIARSSLKDIVNIEDTQVKISLTKHQKADVEVTVVDEKQQQLLSKGKQIQEKIPFALQQMVHLDTNKTKVVFKKKKVESSLLPNAKKAPRVL
ncbi:alkaline shock response membrane anchor protein AmaP [Enterococcus caccae]|uniref:Alkaline shock response membrane anchor protein AmaP n=1 Tax=Enterococcus caccae ATCC BAA-1240 TaxID=1158612 RepID=R3WMH5_9ENTE|nr:alkaline shock response membrane anchor protein AmaP [Enterococcus caccae]EOL49041.1 hypothetical protein UC7_00886 [Enterococcus caccae ATCC BAA-1240]EOT65434.1 hypothetical protein I580_01190 [Enterococcus caccae ATCC BAA-1240]OJG25075.1 hypothetical protein RU98_GL001176 [Enterococcus caccae]